MFADYSKKEFIQTFCASVFCTGILYFSMVGFLLLL